MTNPRQSRPTATFLVLSTVVLIAAAPAADERVHIQPRYNVGDQLSYTWHLSNELSWSPPVKGSDWVKMTTDLEFVLDAQHLMDDGGCLFDFEGQALKSVAEGPKGKLGLKATPTEASILFGKHWLKPGPNTPLDKPMTVTMGRHFQPTASTGLEHIALYLLPGVDPRVWFTITTAPPGPVTVGSSWSHDFDIAIPGAKGKPLHADLTISVAGVERFHQTQVLVLEATASLDLADTDIQLESGEWIHVLHGRYEVTAVVKWDIGRGLLRFAEAKQTLRATADKPETLRLASTAVSRLELDEAN